MVSDLMVCRHEFRLVVDVLALTLSAHNDPIL
jgi:hypothetical protein